MTNPRTSRPAKKAASSKAAPAKATAAKKATPSAKKAASSKKPAPATAVKVVSVKLPEAVPEKPRWPGLNLREPWPVVNAALALVLLAATVTAVVLGVRWQSQHDVERGRQEALAAAKQAAVNFVSVSLSTVDSDMQRIIDAATGDFKEEYDGNKATFRAQIVENKAESTGTVLRAGILSSDNDSAVVLVALDATITNASTPEGRLSHYRMQLDMAKDPGTGRWLVSRLDFVG